ncbi:hypothetical protein NLJ89_g2811 [Agrocybe chaxingu]|uniref:Uncharacterized protein n=1 Tax=Agrocybe chaxingu TaxID=84603 RepID=A0A9W8K5W3_9AGAR|nr:hypothetical protein NLJ89_g2811 [Agrocybe chaxingu]
MAAFFHKARTFLVNILHLDGAARRNEIPSVGRVHDIEAADDVAPNSHTPTMTTTWNLLAHVYPSHLHIYLTQTPHFAADPSSWYTHASGRFISRIRDIQDVRAGILQIRIELAQIVDHRIEGLFLPLERADEEQETERGQRRARDEMIEGIIRRWMLPAIQATVVVGLAILAFKTISGVGWGGNVSETTAVGVVV